MKLNKILSVALSLLLALTAVFSLCPSVSAAEGTLSIGTLEELQEFARRCASDEYSQDLTVLLTDDINAMGEEISIPIFLGTFDGQEHHIYGLSLTASASGYGLFSRIEGGATVRNLTVEGEILPSGTQSRVGGVAGENRGRIEKCSFSGLVSGGSSVGGIVGLNEGVVSGCTVSGVVRGTQYTGGIAGQNTGTLLRCSSSASVNTTVSENDLSAADLENLESTLYGFLKKEEVTENAVTTDTGGIAGYSTGVMQSCTNTGSVGYPHVGYNVGGIAGRQNGYLASCVNRGEVQGRKDVGGIVGQMVPDITLQFSEGGLDELQDELNSLQSLINRTLDDVQSASDKVSARVSRISAYADSARDSADSLANQTGDFVDSNIATVNNLLLLVERYIDKSVPILEDLSTSSGSVTDTISETRKLIAQLDGTLEWNDQALAQLQDFCGEMKAACDDISAGIDALEAALALLGGGPAQPDTDQLRAKVASLRETVASLQETIQQALEELRSSGSISASTRDALLSGPQEVLGRYASVCRELANVLKSINFGALRDQTEENLAQIVAYLQTAMDSFRSAGAHFRSALDDLHDVLGTLREINAQLDGILSQLDVVLSKAEQASSAFAGTLSKLAQWTRELAGEDPGSFTPLGTDAKESGSALNASLSGISTELTALNSEMSSTNTSLLSDVRAVNNQFMKVMNLFLNLLNDTQNVDYTDVFEDVSEKSLQSATRGKVLECRNYGAVTADRNAGGVAGSMAIEYDFDPEDDLLSSENHTSRFTYQTKAILLDCHNYGSVQAKKSCAGGLTGRMDLGTISGCGGWGDVSSESGDYVGGVAGLSLSSIRSSYAKCTLSGGKYVGGIVGSGSRVSDCLSMVAIADCTQLGGAIAGEITDEYTGNRFVSDELAGVDRVSFAGKAEQIRYVELKQLENLPQQFLRMTLRFVADEQTLKELTFDYGDSFGDDVFPEAPSKDGYYVQWDKTDLTSLHFDTVVTAEYEPYVTTLAAQTDSDGSADVLAEGDFRTGDALTVSAEAIPDDAPKGTESVWAVDLPDDGLTAHTVRWKLPADGAKKYAVYVEGDHGWQQVDTEVIGAYLCFEMPGSGHFAVAPANAIPWWVCALIGAAAAALIALLLLLLRKKQTAK